MLNPTCKTPPWAHISRLLSFPFWSAMLALINKISIHTTDVLPIVLYRYQCSIRGVENSRRPSTERRCNWSTCATAAAVLVTSAGRGKWTDPSWNTRGENGEKSALSRTAVWNTARIPWAAYTCIKIAVVIRREHLSVILIYQSFYFFPIFWSHSYFLLSFQENLLFFLFFFILFLGFMAYKNRKFFVPVSKKTKSRKWYNRTSPGRHLNSVNICCHGLFTAPQEDQNSYDCARKQFGWNGLCCYCTVLLREWREMKAWIRSLQLSTCILF